MLSWKSCREKGGGGEFLYNNLKREPVIDLQNETNFMDSKRKEEVSEKKKLL